MVNFFAIFNLKECFNIDKALLDTIYFDFQNKFHPDKASAQDIKKSININEGYAILSDDFLRACHLLALKDVDILKDDKSIKVEQNTLLEILELQEQIAIESDIKNINDMVTKITKNINHLILQSIVMMDNSSYKEAAQILVKAKYFKKCIADLKTKKKNLKNAN